MSTTDQQAIRAKRRAWLLLVARRTDPRRPKLEDVAQAIGLKPTSASSVSDWEWGVAAPKTRYLEALAAYYGIPVGVLLNPPATPTDEERMAEWRAELARAAIGLATEDAQREAEAARDGDAPPEEPPDRQLA